MTTHRLPAPARSAPREGAPRDLAAGPGNEAGGSVQPPARVAVIGYGCRLRGDDAAGLLVAEEMQRGAHPGLEISVLDREGAALIEAWDGCGVAIVIDAVTTGAPAGTLHRFDGRNLPPPAALRLSAAHETGLREAIAVGAALGRLPGRLVIVGIEAGVLDPGAPLTPEVEAALKKAKDAVLSAVETPRGARPTIPG